MNLQDFVYFTCKNSGEVTGIRNRQLGQINYFSFGRYGKTCSKLALAYRNPYFKSKRCLMLRNLSKYWSGHETLNGTARLCGCSAASPVVSLSF